MSLESSGGFIGSFMSPLSSWLSEKIADRFGSNESALKQVLIQSVVFAILFFPVMLLVCAALLFAGFAIHYLFSLFQGAHFLLLQAA
jgi:hypothetical protein